LRYTFVRKVGSRYGELHRERAGFVKIVARAYLNSEGWLSVGDGSWRTPGSFRVQTEEPPALVVPVPVLDRVVAEAMQHARRLLGERFHAQAPANPRDHVTSSGRDMHQESP
jgi:hypothetical protein